MSLSSDTRIIATIQPKPAVMRRALAQLTFRSWPSLMVIAIAIVLALAAPTYWDENPVATVVLLALSSFWLYKCFAKPIWQAGAVSVAGESEDSSAPATMYAIDRNGVAGHMPPLVSFAAGWRHVTTVRRGVDTVLLMFGPAAAIVLHEREFADASDLDRVVSLAGEAETVFHRRPALVDEHLLTPPNDAIQSEPYELTVGEWARECPQPSAGMLSGLLGERGLPH